MGKRLVSYFFDSRCIMPRVALVGTVPVGTMPVGTVPCTPLAYAVRSSSDDFTGSPGRKTQSVSVSDVSPAMNITEESSDVQDRYSPSSLALLTSGGISHLTGPHPRSERGHVYILTCVDAFTKWAEAFPHRSKKAEPIAKVLVVVSAPQCLY